VAVALGLDLTASTASSYIDLVEAAGAFRDQPA